MRFEATNTDLRGGARRAFGRPAGDDPRTPRHARRAPLFGLPQQCRPSLIGALAARYPVARRIAGDDAFRALARAYIRARKPRSPVMIAYGEDFPEFVASCEGPEPCLADLARLENAYFPARPANTESGKHAKPRACADSPRSLQHHRM